MSDHGYPRNAALLAAEIPLVTKANKNFLIGEPFHCWLLAQDCC